MPIIIIILRIDMYNSRDESVCSTSVKKKAGGSEGLGGVADKEADTCDSHYTRFRHPRFRIYAVLFQHYEEHQHHIRGQILKSVICVEPSPGLSDYVMQLISLVSTNSGDSLT
jgi:hypothetical protein